MILRRAFGQQQFLRNIQNVRANNPRSDYGCCCHATLGTWEQWKSTEANGSFELCYGHRVNVVTHFNYLHCQKSQTIHMIFLQVFTESCKAHRFPRGLVLMQSET